MIIHKEPKEELLSTIVEVQKPKSIEGFQKVVELVASITVSGDKGLNFDSPEHWETIRELEELSLSMFCEQLREHSEMSQVEPHQETSEFSSVALLLTIVIVILLSIFLLLLFRLG